jgi:hypothetical protein
MNITGKDLLLFWGARFKKLEVGGNIPKCGSKRIDIPILLNQMFQSFVVNMRWRVIILGFRRFWGAQSRRNWWRKFGYWRWVLVLFRAVYYRETRRKVDQMHTTLQMVPWRLFRYRRLEQIFFALSVTLNKCSAVYLNYNVWQNIFVPFFQYSSFSLLQPLLPFLFDSPGIFMW